MTDLLYSEVEDALRASVRDLLADRAPLPAVLKRTETDEPYDPALWQALASDLGVAGLAVPEDRGGQGASWREVAVVAEELGASVAATPFLGNTMATAAARVVRASNLVPPLVSGELTATLVAPLAADPGRWVADVQVRDGTIRGRVPNVIDAVSADVLLFPTEAGLLQVDAAEATRIPVPSLDMTRPLCDVTFDDAGTTVLADADGCARAMAAAALVGGALLGAEQLGLARRCLELTVDYVQARFQFGRAIGSFQALKHRVADLWVAISQAQAVARYAAGCVADHDPDAPVAAALALAYCGPVAVHAAEECLQLHGGIGFTWEHPAHLYLKRAKADAILLGTAAAHRARLAELVDLPAAERA